MKSVDYTFPDVAHNLALEESLLYRCESGLEDEVLCLWEPQQYCVVLGVSNKVHQEVDVEACRERNVPIIRRSSGGGTVLQGPGCLNYALIIRPPHGADLRDADATNTYVLDRHAKMIGDLLKKPVIRQGTSDLTLNNLKFSGNAQRRLKQTVLFHGSFLFNPDFDLMETVLHMPSRRPDYRQNRRHREFLTTLPLAMKTVKARLQTDWNARTPLGTLPKEDIEKRVKDRYSQTLWNLKI